jgi:hypothetical protein
MVSAEGAQAEKVRLAVPLPPLRVPEDLGPHARIVVSRLSGRFITYIMWSEPREICSGGVCAVGSYDTIRGALLAASAASYSLGCLPIMTVAERRHEQGSSSTRA